MSDPAAVTPSSMPSTPLHEGGDATMHTEDEMMKDKCCTCRNHDAAIAAKFANDAQFVTSAPLLT